ncbi:MAG: NnrU family protein [Candidatus Binatia bacterium]|nr:NnrU family protein [Candidatus Binatia bacterium]
MAYLALAALYFLGIHIFVSGSRLRDTITARTGEQGFLGLFSSLSLVGIVWVGWAYAAAPAITLWASPLWFRPLALVLVLVAGILVVVGVTTPSPTATGFDFVWDQEEPATGILRITRHPFLVGVALWGATHLIASGDAAGTTLFGTMLLLGLVGPGLIDRKRSRRLGAQWESVAAVTSVVPFAAILQGRNRFVASEIGVWRPAAACAAYAILLGAHAWLFGVNPLSF